MLDWTSNAGLDSSERWTGTLDSASGLDAGRWTLAALDWLDSGLDLTKLDRALDRFLLEQCINLSLDCTVKYPTLAKAPLTPTTSYA